MGEGETGDCIEMNCRIAAQASGIEPALMETAHREEIHRREKPTVAHIKGTYLPLSQNWVDTQVKHLQDWEPLVLAHSTDNLDTVEWKSKYFSRCDDLPYLVRKMDGALSRVFGVHPSHYLKARQYDVDLLHAHFGYWGYNALKMKKMLNIPLVTTFYGHDISGLPREKPWWESRYQVLFREGNLFLVEGPHMGKQLEEYGCPPEKIEVCHLGVEPDSYPYRPRQRGEGEPLRVLMSGRFTEKKGFPDGLCAFARFLECGGKGSLTIIGDANESEHSQAVRQELLRIVERRSIKERVTFKGFVPREKLKDAYYQHHVLLSPSREASSGDNEGGAPVTLIEAQATGMPVISTHHCDIPEVVIDNKTGYLTEEGDVEALADALENVSDEETMRAFGKSASSHVRREYSAEIVGKNLESIYSRCMQ